MNLYIASTGNGKDDTFWVTPAMLSDRPTHLYLACNRWTEMEVVLSDDIPTDVLKYTKDKCDTFKVVDDGNPMTTNKVDVLCELYPEKAGALRKSFMLGKNVYDVL